MRLGEAWWKFESRDPLLARCLPWWLALLVPTVLIEQATGPGWATVAAILSPLTGAMGAVVLGAFSVDRWRQQAAIRERRRRVSRMSRMLRQEHETIRETMAEIVSGGYAIAAPLLDSDEQVPEALLVSAMTRPAYTPPKFHREGEPLEDSLQRTMLAVVENAGDLMYRDLSGPVPWAQAQLHQMWLTASPLLDVPDTDSPLMLNYDAAEEVLHRLESTAPRLLEACESLNERLRDLNALNVYRPVHQELAEDDIEIETASLLHHGRLAVDNARRLRQLAQAVGDDRERELLADVLQVLRFLVAEVKAASDLVGEQTVELTKYQDSSSPLAAVSELQDELVRGGHDAMRRLDHARWKSFTRDATPINGIPVEEEDE